jgi:hypothetical protein
MKVTTKWAQAYAVNVHDPVLRDVAADLLEARKALEAVKLRMHFIGWPAESFWSPNDDGRTIPDWRKEIALVEHALTGNVLPGFPVDAATELK